MATYSPPTPALSDTALFLDIDGTLLPLQSDPAGVASDPVLRQKLTELVTRTDGALALVSGRTLADIDRIFAPLAFSAAGTHGGEIRHRGADLSPPGLSALDEMALKPIADFVAANRGLLLENKGVSVTLHFRERPDLEADCRAMIDALYERHPEGMQVIAGKMVFELTPIAANKGAAIQRLLGEPPFRGRQPVFLGDDTTDEAGFTVVNDAGGLSVLVGERDTTAATHRLEGVAAVHGWLSNLIAKRE
ncbi:MAG: trehalose-phosphatase [Pseudomonadota bacterium]